MNWVYGAVVVAILAKLVVQLAFERLNRASALAQREKVPAHLRGVITPETHQQAAEYTLEHSRLDASELVYGAFLKLALLTCGVLPLLYNATVLHFGAQNFWAQALLMSLIGIALSVFFWPFEWASIFGIEARYGFNRQTPWLWFTDQLKGYAVGIVLTVPLAALVLWMSSGIIRNWWLWAFIVVMIYEVVLEFVYPNFIEPLFNKFEPLPEGTLRTRLEGLCQRAKVSVEKILVMDASRRSRHANAYFAGIGEARRIVLYDTLLEQLSDAEVEAVLAHEIGHMKHQHTLRHLYVGGAWQLLAFAIVNALLGWRLFYEAFGFSPEGGNAAAFLVLSLIGGAFAFWMTPMMSQWYRAHEYEADAYAAKLTGGAPLISGLKKMTKESLASIEDHPLARAFYASHPTVQEREEALQKAQLMGATLAAESAKA